MQRLLPKQLTPNYSGDFKKRQVEFDKLKFRLEQINNFFDDELIFYIDNEQKYIIYAMFEISRCTNEFELLKIIGKFNRDVSKNNIEALNYVINNWQPKFMVSYLKEKYNEYYVMVRQQESIIGVAKILKLIGKHCYDEINRRKDKIHKQMKDKIRIILNKYSCAELNLLSEEINKFEKNLESKIIKIYFSEKYMDFPEYFEKEVEELYCKFEEEVLKMLKLVTSRKKKIIDLQNYFSFNKELEQLIVSKISYLYQNILDLNFNILYSEALNEIESEYYKINTAKLPLNQLKDDITKNYLLAISQLDILKNKNQIKLITKLYYQALELLERANKDDRLRESILQLSNIDFLDLKSTQEIINQLITFITPNIYIKKNSVIVDNSQIEEFGDAVSISNLSSKKWISLKQFLAEAVYIGKFIKAKQKMIALYAHENRILVFDPINNKFKFISNRVSYLSDANVPNEIISKLHLYSTLVDYYSGKNKSHNKVKTIRAKL